MARGNANRFSMQSERNKQYFNIEEKTEKAMNADIIVDDNTTNS